MGELRGTEEEMTKRCDRNSSFKHAPQPRLIRANYYASLANSSWLTHLASLSVTEHTPPQDVEESGIALGMERMS